MRPKGASGPTHLREEGASRSFSFIEPMNALPVEKPPEGDWLYEIKFGWLSGRRLSKTCKDVRGAAGGEAGDDTDWSRRIGLRPRRQRPRRRRAAEKRDEVAASDMHSLTSREGAPAVRPHFADIKLRLPCHDPFGSCGYSADGPLHPGQARSHRPLAPVRARVSADYPAAGTHHAGAEGRHRDVIRPCVDGKHCLMVA